MADAYVVLPLHTFEREARELTKLKIDDRPGNPEILYLSGQADLLAQFRLTDFRHVVGTRYPVERSAARVFNWIFAVPYVRDPGAPAATPRLRFMVHLRVHRGVYAVETASMDAKIIKYLEKQLRDAECTAEIQAGLGWADFIIDGSLDPQHMKKFVRFLFAVSEADIRCSQSKTRPRPIFVRMLTLLGYHWGTPRKRAEVPWLDKIKPVIFGRAEAGRMREAIRLLQRAVRVKTSTHLIDGRSDFVILCDEPAPNVLERLWPLDNPGGQSPIHKMETHLLFGNFPDRGMKKPYTSVCKTAKPRPRCSCHRPVQFPDLGTKVPDELQQPVAHMKLLFRNVIRDEMSCCDVSEAVRGASHGLTRLHSELVQRLDRLANLEKRLISGRGDPAKLEKWIRLENPGIEKQQHKLELWYLFAERMLRQRTTGSFDELFLQSDRAVVYRGSVQKFLYLADCLMNDFAARVSRRPVAGTLFAAFYDAVRRTDTLKGAGLVRIPVRHLFTLSDVIPDLWHEVGVYLFNLYVRPSSLNLRLSEDGQGVYQILADYYGDLVVYSHGFGGDWLRFVISLTRGWIDSKTFQEMPQFVRQEQLADLLARLLFVHALRVDTRPFEFASAKQKAKGLHGYLRETFKPRNATSPERIPDADGEVFASAALMLKEKQVKYGAILTKKLEQTVKPDAISAATRGDYAAWVASYDGSVVEFDKNTDMNALFGELYWSFRQEWLDGGYPKGFQRMAGLARSATLEYHRRQID